MMTKNSFQRISIGQAGELLARENLLLLDSRDAAAFERGHIQSALRLTPANIETYILGKPKNTPVLIYCNRGNASRTHAQTFVDFGFSEVYSLDGGFEAWSKSQAGNASVAPDHATRSWLLEQGYPPSDVNAVADHGITPLMRAGKMGDIAIAADLIRAGARIETRNSDGNNALWMACVGNSLPMIRLLLAAKIDIDNQNDNGATCLMYAASTGKARVVAQLIAAGAKVTLQSLDGLTALEICSTAECLDLLRHAR